MLRILPKRPTARSGFILISTILVLAISSLMIMNSFEQLLQHSRAVNNLKSLLQCYYHADSGIMQARALLAASPGFVIADQTLSLPDGILKITNDDNKIIMDSTCANGFSKLQLTVIDKRLDEINPRWQKL